MLRPEKLGHRLSPDYLFRIRKQQKSNFQKINFIQGEFQNDC